MVKLNGLNYAYWSERIQFQLGVMDLDLALVCDKNLTTIIETSTEADKSLYGVWKRSNRLRLNLMKMMMTENVNSSMPKTNNEKEFMLKIKGHSH